MNLKVERAKRNWTQEELARQSGVGRITISNIENGKQRIENMTVRVLINISRALDIPITSFFEE